MRPRVVTSLVAISGDRTTKLAIAAGDILHAGLSGGVYTIELGESDPKGTPVGFLTNDGVNNSGEFFYGDFYTGSDASHHESTLGGVGLLSGTNEVLTTAYDPSSFWAQGVRTLNTLTGIQNKAYRLFATRL